MGPLVPSVSERARTFDGIYAHATPRGVGARSVFRLSGDRVLDVAGGLACCDLATERAAREGELQLGEGRVTLPCSMLVFPAPASYTGEDVVELHTISSPAVVELIAESLEAAGLRPATPGEFTRRAFQNGKLELDQAEAVIAVIGARDATSLQCAEDLLHTKTSRTSRHRRALLEVLSVLESGLDFESGDTGEVDPSMWRPQLEQVCAELGDAVGRESAKPSGLPSFLLLGPPNAGKTSLWNALADGAGFGIVSDVAGTTRDVRWAACDGGRYRLGDAPGRAHGWERDAAEQELKILRQELALVDGYCWVESCCATPRGAPDALGAPALVVQSKRDLALFEVDGLGCSVRTGHGMEALRAELAALGARSAWAAEWETGMHARLAAAHAAVVRALDRSEPECIAADLRESVAALEPMDATRVPEEVLDRVFSGFCIGK